MIERGLSSEFEDIWDEFHEKDDPNIEKMRDD